MRTKKDLDQLYKEKLQKTEIKPPANVWNRIADELPAQKKKKKVLPLYWYRAAGVAAALLLLALISEQFKNDTPAGGTAVHLDVDRVLDLPGHEAMFLDFSKQLAQSGDLLRSLSSAPIPEEVAAPAREERTRQRMLHHDSAPARPMVVKPKADLFLLPRAIVATELNLPEAEEAFQRLSVSTKVAQIYHQSSSVGSDPSSASVAYGISVAYAVSEDLNIRSGLNRMDVNYEVRQLSFEHAAQAIGKPGATTLAAPVGEVRQRAEFLEVPLELEYALLSKKLELNLIGGGSFLFTRKEELSLRSPGNIYNFQNSQNIPDGPGYTANVGLGLTYELLESVRLQLEPVVKFRLDRSSYLFGVYSGFSYRF